MSSTLPLDPTAVRRRARWAFLRGRLGAARLEVALACALIVVAALTARQPRVVLLPAVVLVALTTIFSLGGRAPGRAVLPGLLLGLLPLGCSLGAARLGHVCWDGGCSSLCVPLCAAGGVVSGLLLARAARTTARPFTVWLAGGSVVLATGALGCACVGAGGVWGMLLGFLPSATLLAWPVRRDEGHQGSA